MQGRCSLERKGECSRVCVACVQMSLSVWSASAAAYRHMESRQKVTKDAEIDKKLWRNDKREDENA